MGGDFATFAGQVRLGKLRGVYGLYFWDGSRLGGTNGTGELEGRQGQLKGERMVHTASAWLLMVLWGRMRRWVEVTTAGGWRLERRAGGEVVVQVKLRCGL